MQGDINRLVQKPIEEKQLDAATSPPAIRSKTGLERKTAGSVDGQEVVVQSTDGVFTFTLRVIRT